MDKLSKLFGSVAKVKILRLFLFNPQTVFSSSEISKKAGVRPSSVRKVLNHLDKAGLVKRKPLPKTKKKGKQQKGWVMDTSSPHAGALKNLLMPADALSDFQIEKKIKKVGKVKLIVVSGIFLHSDDTRIDILIVTEGDKTNNLSGIIRDLESHLGTELRYSVLNSDDFMYRRSIGDRLVRDVFECPHRVIVNKLGL